MGMTIIEKIFARKAGLDVVSRGRHRRRRRRHDRADRPAVRHDVDAADPDPRSRQAGHRHGPRGSRPDHQGRRRRPACPKVRRRLRHRALLRRRQARYLPPGHRRERAGPPRRSAGLHRLSHLRRRRLQHRGPRTGSRRGVFDHVHRQHLVSGRADDPLRTRGRQARTVSGKDIFLHIANEYGDARQPEPRVRRPGTGRASRCTTGAPSRPRAPRCRQISAPSSPTRC